MQCSIYFAIIGTSSFASTLLQVTLESVCCAFSNDGLRPVAAILLAPTHVSARRLASYVFEDQLSDTS